MKCLFLSMQGCPRIIGFDYMVASALTYRGHQVSFMGCGLALPACDCSDLTVMPTFGADCQDPRPLGVARNLRYNLPQLRRYLRGDDVARTAETAKEYAGSVEAVLGATYKGLPVGEMAHQSWRNFWRSVRPRDVDKPEPSVFSFLKSAVLLTDLWERALGELQPDLLWTLNGLYTRQRIPCEMMRAAGKRYVTYDVHGPSFHLHHNEGAPHLRHDAAMKAVEPTEQEMQAAVALLEAEKRKPGISWGEDYLAGASPVADWNSIKFQYRLDERPICAWFPNVAYDSGVVGWPGSFPDLPDVVDATIGWFEARPQYQLVFRMHPNERNDPHMTLKGETLTAYLQQWYPKLPENVRIIPAESNASSFTLASKAAVNVVWTSSLAYQLPYEGYPTIISGFAACGGHGIGHDAPSMERYWDLLEAGMNGQLKVEPEVKRNVLKYKAVAEGRCRIDFSPVIGKGDFNVFVPQWSGGWAALKPGAMELVDMVCECILSGEPFYWPR